MLSKISTYQFDNQKNYIIYNGTAPKKDFLNVYQHKAHNKLENTEETANAESEGQENQEENQEENKEEKENTQEENKQENKYDIPSEGCHISYQPLAKASNQMQFRPLRLCQASDLNGASYQISFEARDFGKEDSFDKELYPASKKDLLKYISKLCLEEEPKSRLRQQPWSTLLISSSETQSRELS